jgi:hypothetical protein
LLSLLLEATLPLAMSVRVGLLYGVTFWFGFVVFDSTVQAIDICDQGIVIGRLHFVPWRQLRRTGCRLDAEGKLELRHGWYRATVFAPQQHREAVRAFLEEKLAVGKPG